MVIVPGDGESADWPQVVSPLRHKLPNAGWSTLSLTLPDPQAPSLPPRPEAAPQHLPDRYPPKKRLLRQPTTAVKLLRQKQVLPSQRPPARLQSLKPHRSVISNASSTASMPPMEAARQEKPARLILLGHGSGAYWAAQYLSEKKPDDIQNLLLVSAEPPKGFTGNAEELLASLKLATGDFYYKDQPQDRQAALKRMQAGKRQQHPAYVQVAMKALPGNPEIESEQLFRRIRGWLDLQIKAAP